MSPSAGDILAQAKAILADPCWKTHAFCKHAPFVWKKVKEYGRECARGAVGGAIVGGIMAGGAGVVSGAAWGCAGGIASAAADDILTRIGGSGAFGGNAGVQCAIGAVAVGGTYYSATRGGSARFGQAAWSAGGGCVGGFLQWFTDSVMSRDPAADRSATGVGQCGSGAAVAIGFSIGQRSPWNELGLGALATCVGSLAGELIR